MTKRTNKQTYTSDEFEILAQKIMSMALTMSEERIHAATKLKSPTGHIMAEVAMTLRYALRAFLAVSRLPGK